MSCRTDRRRIDVLMEERESGDPEGESGDLEGESGDPEGVEGDR